MRRLLPVVLAGALLLGACGSSGSGATSTTTRLPGTEAQRTLAQAGKVGPATLPAGFQQVANRPTTAVDVLRGVQQNPKCPAFTSAAALPEVSQFSTNYQRDTTIASSSVQVYKTEADAAARLATLQAPSTATCLESIYRTFVKQAVGDQATLTNLTVTPLESNPAGDKGFGYQLSYTLTVGANSQTVTGQILGAQVGSTVVFVYLEGPEDTLAPTAQAVVPALTDALTKAQQ